MIQGRSAQKRVLVIGKDARTSALAVACADSAEPAELYAFSELQIPDLIRVCKDIGIGKLTDVDAVCNYAQVVRPSIAIIGPEEPLAAGVVDALEKRGIPCFGPCKDLARIESSKSWTRELLSKYSVPGNPTYRIFTSTAGLEDYLERLGEFVIKPDGLTGGKGVRVFGEHLESIAAAIDYAGEQLLSHPRIVVEEKLSGEEFSLQTITDGESAVHCPLVQDHKRAFEGDAGPNTGGMGSYSCPDFSLPFLRREDVEEACRINSQVIRVLQEETKRLYRGILYGGFMATPDGVKVIEYNARFGDPEALNILPILETDFLGICESVVSGRLEKKEVRFASKATVCKYVVPESYPYGPSVALPLGVPQELQSTRNNVRVYCAAVNQVGQDIIMTGSRAVAVVGIGPSLDEAERRAESAAAAVSGPVRHRRDIGTFPLVSERVRRMETLRSRQNLTT